MKIKSLLSTAILMFALSHLPVSLTACDSVLIANPTDASGNLDERSLKDLMLGKTRRWDSSGAPVTIAMVKDDSIVSCFLEEQIGKSSSAFNNHWKRLVFTGKGSQPRTFDTEQEVVQFVALNNGAVGIVSKQAPNAQVAVVTAR
jgi:ABC-type phosphate transport system substrate-binding protein